MINYIEKGIGLHDFLAKEGVQLEQLQSGEWVSTASDERTNNLIASYNPWPAEKTKKLLEINSWFQGEVEKLTAGTAQAERDSWSVQVDEAYGIRPVVMLSSMAEARGITLESLMLKVKAKAELFSIKYGSLQGTKDALEDKVKAFPDADELDRLQELWALKCTG
jgi:hypothetical protein